MRPFIRAPRRAVSPRAKRIHRTNRRLNMKKLIAILALTAAIATPALASDGSESVMHNQRQAGYVAMSNGMGSYAFATRGNWQAAQDANIRHQSQIQWEVSDR
jgi:hypothetical protein